MDCTTIQISIATRQRLAKFRRYRRETYDELLNALLDLVPTGDDEGEYSDQFIEGLMRARRDIKEGKVVSHEKMKRMLGLKHA